MSQICLVVISMKFFRIGKRYYVSEFVILSWLGSIVNKQQNNMNIFTLSLVSVFFPDWISLDWTCLDRSLISALASTMLLYEQIYRWSLAIFDNLFWPSYCRPNVTILFQFYRLTIPTINTFFYYNIYIWYTYVKDKRLDTFVEYDIDLSYHIKHAHISQTWHPPLTRPPPYKGN